MNDWNTEALIDADPSSLELRRGFVRGKIEFRIGRS
jgi:hypothetical protein